jgi:hypothetical protein
MKLDEIKGPDGKPTGEVKAYWQVKSSLIFNAICSFPAPSQYIEAHYDNIKDLLGRTSE